MISDTIRVSAILPNEGEVCLESGHQQAFYQERRREKSRTHLGRLKTSSHYLLLAHMVNLNQNIKQN